MRLYSRRQSGFSLMEIAIGMLILGTILVSMTDVYEFMLDSNRQSQEQKSIKAIDDAVNTYLVVNRYLPCPDTDTVPDGVENRTEVAGVSYCTSREGGLPYTDLGVQALDAWGNAYYYRVHQRADVAIANDYINEICQPASVLGLSGTRGADDLWMCPETNIYYCKDAGSASTCDNVCPSACIDTIDPRPATSVGSPPFFHLATPPYGSLYGDGNIVMRDAGGNQLGEGVVAVVVSWGANGKTVYRNVSGSNCTGATTDELENCDNDRNFVNTQTGLDRDFVTWVTVNQAKMALIQTGAYR